MAEFHIKKHECVKLFWICAGMHLVLWTLIPALTSPNLLTDVIEGYAWGHEWQLGTYKHPPLASWILEALALVTGRASWASFFASQLSVLVAFWAVWQTGRRIVSEAAALIGALLLVGVAYYNVITPEFNPNVLQLPFWALIGWSFHRAVKDNRATDWALLGIWSAAGLYAKYSTGLMIASLAALLITHRESRKRFGGIGPWLAILVGFTLFMPHLLWLINHDFLPFAYTQSRFEPVAPSGNFILAPARLILWQVAACLPAILIYLIAFRRAVKPSRKTLNSFDGMFLSFATFGPFVFAFVIAAVGGFKMQNMWGTPFWNFLGLWAMFHFHPALTTASVPRFARSLLVVFILGLGITAAKNIYEPYVTHKAGRIYFPGRALAEQISQEWQRRYHTPLRYIIGDTWVAGNIGFYAPERPQVLIAGDYGISPWVAPKNIAKYGGIIIWCRGDCTHQDIYDTPPWYWPEFSKQASTQTVLTLPQQTAAPVPPAKIGWAILPPTEQGP